jgi:serine protease AprX
VAGIIAENGSSVSGFYQGVAPKANLINLKISGEDGLATESDAVAAMQWVYENKAQYNIRVVNLSFQTMVEMSYHLSPVAAAAEILWFNGVVVVAASGNWDPQGVYSPTRAAPANDPFIITVGAFNEKGTTNVHDDSITKFTAFGNTQEGYFKPEINAPGMDIISTLASDSPWASQHPDHVVLFNEYIRLSGSSMAAPMVSGAAALLLQAEPGLTPDQVKYRLMQSARWASGLRYVDVYAALTTPTTRSANIGLAASQLLWPGSEPVTWTGVAWNAVAWNAVAWNAVAWNAVAWNSVYWGP